MNRYAVAALLVFALAAPASANPGQSISQFERWAHGNATLHGLNGNTSLDGSVTYDVSFQAGPSTANFHAQSGKDALVIESESITLAAPDDFRFDQHRAIAGRLVSAVYGFDLAEDFRSAPLTATAQDDIPTLFYRGKLFGYEITGARIVIRTLDDFAIDEAAQTS